jgi:hypothetical protein
LLKTLEGVGLQDKCWAGRLEGRIIGRILAPVGLRRRKKRKWQQNTLRREIAMEPVCVGFSERPKCRLE